MRRRLSLLLTVALLGLAPSAMAQSPGPQVSGFSPQGSVKQVRQVRVQFSEPMVPLGDPRLTDPFDVVCAEAGTGRWVDTAIWVFDFARDDAEADAVGQRVHLEARVALYGRELGRRVQLEDEGLLLVDGVRALARLRGADGGTAR